MGTLFVDDTNLYTWKDGLLNTGELWLQTQLELTQWSTLLNATGGALKPENCFWYMLDYTCKDGEWSYAAMTPRELFVTNPDGTKSLINQEEVPIIFAIFGRCFAIFLDEPVEHVEEDGVWLFHAAFGRFARKTSERVAFIVTMSALVFRSRAFAAFSVLRSLSELHVEKSGTASTSGGNGKKVEGYASVVKKE